MSEPSNILTPYIKRLVVEAAQLTPDDLSEVLKLIFQGKVSDVQIGSFLTGIRMLGLDQKAEYIASAVRTVMEFTKPISIDHVPGNGFVDIVGTGGDGQNTFNVSTASSIVAAGMGIPVCKHGGKAATSSSGSGDLLKCLGVDLMKVNKDTAVQVLSNSAYSFLFAPAFHGVMHNVVSVRKQLGIPTIFNILGPLINPAPLNSRILGVYSKELGQAYAEAVLELSRNDTTHVRTMVVHGGIGLDEISPVGETHCWIVENDEIVYKILSPQDFGLPENSLDTVTSGTPEENAELLLHILKQDEDQFTIKPHNAPNHPIVDYILLNSAALAVVYGLTDSYTDAVDLAKQSIVKGTALAALESFKSTLANL